mmetsp:Transcript_19038/g.39999  ORF Transcript_19038/g.39999 Transcript_19038/m.39999 type:complete len:1020 (-) Transcript_19038:129-3188(-)
MAYPLPSHLQIHRDIDNEVDDDIPASSIIIGNDDANTIDDSSLECSLYTTHDEERAVSSNAAVRNGTPTSHHDNKTNHLQMDVRTASPCPRAAAYGATGPTRRDTRYRQPVRDERNANHAGSHAAVSGDDGSIDSDRFFPTISRFINRQPRAQKCVFFTSVFFILSSLGLAAVGLGLSLGWNGTSDGTTGSETSSFSASGVGGGGDIVSENNMHEEARFTALVNAELPVSGVKSLLNSTADSSEWPTYAPTYTPTSFEPTYTPTTGKGIATTAASTESSASTTTSSSVSKSTENEQTATAATSAAKTQAPNTTTTKVPATVTIATATGSAIAPAKTDASSAPAIQAPGVATNPVAATVSSTNATTTVKPTIGIDANNSTVIAAVETSSTTSTSTATTTLGLSSNNTTKVPSANTTATANTTSTGTLSPMLMPTPTPSLAPIPIPVLSCVDFKNFAVIDSKAVLYYSLVPSSFPGANNGLFCARIEYDGLGWLALGVSRDGQMIGSEAIIGLPDEGTVLKYTLGGKTDELVTPMEESKQTLQNTLIGQENGRTVMEFTKLLVEDGEIPIQESGINYFLHAKGFDNALGYHLTRWSFEIEFQPSPLEQASMEFPTSEPTTWMPTIWPTFYPTVSHAPTVRASASDMDNTTAFKKEMIVFYPDADTFIESGTNNTMGDKKRLKVDAKPERISFLRFDVLSAVNSGLNVSTITLRLHALTSSSFGGTVDLVSLPACANFNEDTLIWDNAPPCAFAAATTVVGTFGEAKENEWVEAVLDLDLSSVQSSVTLRITSNMDNGVTYSSANTDDGTKPELKVFYTSDLGSIGNSTGIETDPPTFFPTYVPTTWMPTATMAEKMVLVATQDAMLRDGFYSDRMFGLDNFMSIHAASNLDNIRKAIIEFDLSAAVPGISYSFFLKMFVTWTGIDESRVISVYRAKYDFNWSERTVTWNNFGSPAMEKVADYELMYDERDMGVDISLGEFEPVNSKLILLLEITSEPGTGNKVDVLSRNHGWNPPLLIAIP